MAIQTVKAQLLALGVEGIDFEELTLTGTGEPDTYSVQINAPAMSSYNLTDNVFNVKVTATTTGNVTASVDKTNPTFGEQLKLRVYERQKPVVTITQPAADNAYITNTSTPIKWTVTDTYYGGVKDSGINLLSASFTIKKNNEIVTPEEGEITHSEDGGITTFSYLPSGGFTDGNWEISGYVSDYDGNVSETKTRTFIIDTIAPSIDIDAPAVSSTKEVTITGTTDPDETITIIITVGEQEYQLNPDSSGNFSKVVTLKEGENIISAVAKDKAGNTSPVPATVTVTVDSSAPIFQTVTLTPNPADAGATLLLTVKVISQVSE